MSNVLVSRYPISFSQLLRKSGNWMEARTEKSEPIVSGLLAFRVPTRCVQMKVNACVISKADVLVVVLIQ